MNSLVSQSSSAVALYQTSQAIVDRFDKVLVLYEGRQIFFGTVTSAVEYFEAMGWRRFARQPAGDFLAAITNPAQREVMAGFESRVPRSPQDFEARWRESSYYSSLISEIDRYDEDSSQAAQAVLREFEDARNHMKAKRMLSRAPQTISFSMQTRLCVRRAVQQLLNDKASVLTTLGGEVIIALVVASMFHGTQPTTAALFSYGSVLFFAVLLNVLMTITDIHNLYRGRSIICKQVSYAFYRPSAEAFASVLVDIPVKFVVAIFFNIALYFLAGLAVTAHQFFIFFLFVFITTLAMSMIFRTIAAATKTLPQAMAISGFLVLAVVTYTGFVLPGPYMHPWFKWISYINPLAYSFEALLVNEVHGNDYMCNGLVPPYQNLAGNTFICPVPGAVAGQTYVSGDAWFETSYGYSYSHLWRNLGIIFAFVAFFFITYLFFTEMNINLLDDLDIPVFLRDQIPDKAEKLASKGKGKVDIEASPVTGSATQPASERGPIPILAESESFCWSNVCLDIRNGGGRRRLLDNVSGWIRPGTMTALMGVSGAGKTTLLNALAQRSVSGVTVGDFYLDGKPLSVSFKGDIGYVQQQDIHLETSTVREALQFSAILRQPRHVPKQEKLDFVEHVIRILGMEDFANAVVGYPGGKGLKFEQRKRLSIGVELVAKPKLLIFLDEPTSGLDSSSSEAIVDLLKKLAASGLGIICTIHQPSAVLFQRFDRLLLMASGGKVAYFGDIGHNSETVLQYFSSRGPRRCGNAENPAEYLLDTLGQTDYDWPRLWTESPEAKHISTELDHIKGSVTSPAVETGKVCEIESRGAYQLSPLSQMLIVCRRVFQQYWRSPMYIMSKFMLVTACSLFIGFSFFHPGSSMLAVQDAVFSVLMICALFGTLVQQVRIPGLSSSMLDGPKLTG
jgi:ABC-type multidrug transport system ATPase subunit/ABC-type multidrug transport system permease subunit